MYLHAGADYALIVLPRNYAHSHGIWDLFAFGSARYMECLRYKFGTAGRLGQVLLAGYTQYFSRTGEALNPAIRERMRAEARGI